MRLVRLEMKGFKSFAEKTVVHFNHNVTGIVGPNGCGKSNIVDAIRWVLGEQKTAQLRSDKMENVIFNGSKERKAAGLAEVTITFENDRALLPVAYHEVSIKRMLYRSGESEYYLNGVRCRLRDITTLLADTGISPDSYAIIALHMVDDLLHDREDARRRLFEQAAGISKYKSRKAETLQKLKGTETDLERVDDLLFEIDKNLKSLERQARRARRYLELKHEYRQKSVVWAQLRLVRLEHSAQALNTRMQACTDQQTALEAALHHAEAQQQQKKLLLLEHEKSLAEHQRQLQQLVGKIRSWEADKKLLTQKNLFVSQNEEQLHTNIHQADTQIAQLEAEASQLTQQIEAAQQQLSLLQQQMQQAQQHHRQAHQQQRDLQAQLEAQLREQQATQLQRADLDKQSAVAASQAQQAHAEWQRLQQQLQGRQSEQARLRQQQAELSRQLIQAEQALQKAREAEQQRLQQLAETEQALEAAQHQLAGLQRRTDACLHEYRLTQSLVEHLEDFPESVRYLYEHRKHWLPSATLLSDILECPEHYRPALEHYLDAHLNYYIADTPAQALQAIGLLRQADKGKANFWLLRHLPPVASNTADPPTPHPDWVPALQLVRTAPPYQALLYELLQRVWFTPHLEHFERHDTLDLLPDGATLVHNSGGLVYRKGRVSGGAVGMMEGKKIGRRQQLEHLSQQLQQLQAEQAHQQTQVQQLQQQRNELRTHTHQTTVQQYQQQVQQLHRQQITLHAASDSLQTTLHDLQQRQQHQHDTQQRALLLSQQLSDRYQELDTRLNAEHQLTSRLQQQHQALTEAASTAASALSQAQVACLQQQNTLQYLQRDQQYRHQRIAELRQRQESDRRTLQQAAQEKNITNSDLTHLEQAITQAYGTRKQYEADLQTAEHNYYHTRTLVNQLDDQVRQLHRQRQDLLTQLGQLQQQRSQLAHQQTALIERLQVEFQISPDQIPPPDPDTPADPDTIESTVEQLRRQLADFGEVNPMAVEAYDQLKQRYEFIVSQRRDLLEARTSLLHTMADIEDTATQLFLTAFEQVRAHFIQVFRSLFADGDDCDLVLTTPETPLEAHINIIARPKGKRPQTINQLSGGEKTLTATALLFALYLLKPAPFCIFDEVDAPLDDANIAKFNRIIEQFSHRSQFIVVTHNKLTMAAVQVIYGVQMSPPGVSRLVPVDFSALPPAPLQV